MKITITTPKKTYIIISVILIPLVAILYYISICDGSYFAAIEVTTIELIVISYSCVKCGTSYVFDESGVSRIVFGRKRLFLTWDECVYIGVFNSLHSDVCNENDSSKTFACAKTPLMHRSKRDAREHEYGLMGNPDERINPSWKQNEAVKIPYELIGDENYAKILTLCGGERIAEDLAVDEVSPTSCTMDAGDWTEITSDCRHKPKLTLKECMKYAFSKNSESIHKNRRCRKCGRAIDVKNDRRVNIKESALSLAITLFIPLAFIAAAFLAVRLKSTGANLPELWIKIALGVLVALIAFAAIPTGRGLASYIILKCSAEWTGAEDDDGKENRE